MMKKEQDFEKAVLDSLSSLKKDIDNLKREDAVLKQQVTEYMGRIHKIVEGQDSARTEFTAKLYKVVMTNNERVDTLNRLMDATQKMINTAALDKLSLVLEKIDQAIKSGKL